MLDPRFPAFSPTGEKEYLAPELIGEAEFDGYLTKWTLFAPEEITIQPLSSVNVSSGVSIFIGFDYRAYIWPKILGQRDDDLDYTLKIYDEWGPNDIVVELKNRHHSRMITLPYRSPLCELTYQPIPSILPPGDE